MSNLKQTMIFINSAILTSLGDLVTRSGFVLFHENELSGVDGKMAFLFAITSYLVGADKKFLELYSLLWHNLFNIYVSPGIKY